jgi:hypothetical protein
MKLDIGHLRRALPRCLGPDGKGPLMLTLSRQFPAGLEQAP